MKNVPSRVFIVFFATYGIDGNELVNYTGRRLPYSISPIASISLHPTKWVDHGLRFSREEFNEYLASRISAGFPCLQQDVELWVYRISGGHIGAIEAVARFIATASVS